MKKIGRARSVAVLAVFALTLSPLVSQVGLAYQGCQSGSSASASPTAGDPNQPVDFTATFRTCDGSGINGAAVTFSQQSGPPGCAATFSPVRATTDANGQARTTVMLPPGCPCEYTLAATSSGITVTTTVRENGCLPFTAAARPGASVAAPHGPGLPPLSVVIGGFLAAALLGAGLRFARGRLSRA